MRLWSFNTKFTIQANTWHEDIYDRCCNKLAGKRRMWSHKLPSKRQCSTLLLGLVLGATLSILYIKKQLHPERFVFASSQLYVQPLTGYNHFLQEPSHRQYLTPRSREVSPLSPLVLSPSQACRESSFFVVLSVCRPDAVDRRKTIRDTWASAVKSGNWPGSEKLPVTGDVVFVLGNSESQSKRKLVELEARQHGDLIVGGFLDSYNNLTRKTLTGLNWVTNNCLHTRFVVKLDEDTFLDFPRLVQFLIAQQNSLQGKIIGKLYFNSETFKKGKWKMSKDEYPFTTYPQFAGGPCYLLSTAVVPSIVNRSRFLPPLHLEDVAVTGIIAESLRIERVHMDQLQNFRKSEHHLCDLIGQERYQISITSLSNEAMQLIWRIITSEKCLKQPDAT